ncbi:hypothetical protein ACJMK2_039651 [Sinanodonta woodiana]|uniref:Uncharacterized protein n=1 Tax=Sinanodonta woodiana TaxID=1069815 RepID=A0ABD3WDL8_SINWO
MSTKSTKDYKSSQDHIFEYSNVLLWRGPVEIARDDAKREYKEAVKTASGNLTDDTIARHSQMVGLKKKNICVVRRNTEDLVKILLDNKCEFIAGRCHSAFPNINSFSTFNQMGVFKKRIQKHLKKMSKRRDNS